MPASFRLAPATRAVTYRPTTAPTPERSSVPHRGVTTSAAGCLPASFSVSADTTNSPSRRTAPARGGVGNTDVLNDDANQDACKSAVVTVTVGSESWRPRRAGHPARRAGLRATSQQRLSYRRHPDPRHGAGSKEDGKTASAQFFRLAGSCGPRRTCPHHWPAGHLPVRGHALRRRAAVGPAKTGILSGHADQQERDQGHATSYSASVGSTGGSRHGVAGAGRLRPGQRPVLAVDRQADGRRTASQHEHIHGIQHCRRGLRSDLTGQSGAVQSVAAETELRVKAPLRVFGLSGQVSGLLAPGTSWPLNLGLTTRTKASTSAM